MKIAAPEIAEIHFLRRAGLERWRWRDLGCGHAARLTRLTDELADVGVAGIAEGHRFGEVRREVGDAVLGADQAPHQVRSRRLERPVVKVVTTIPTGRLHVGAQPRHRAGQVGQSHLEEWRFRDPRDHVATVEPAGTPRRAPAREEHVSSRLEQLFGQLTAGLPASDDEHLSLRKRVGVRVLLGIDGVQRR